jgi:HNH endonuclease
MSHVPDHLRRPVIGKAANRCEYCLRSQVGQEATFHFDHIIPESQGGETKEANLALACVSCSLRKAARQSGLDSETGKRVPLFHPRRDVWTQHFRWDGVEIQGITVKGRATVRIMRLNRPSILLIREEEALHGRFSP